MVSDFDILHEMIKDSAKVGLEEEYGKRKLILCEPQEEDCDVVIHGVPEETIAIKVDLFDSPNLIFEGKRGECRRADYLIVANKSKKLFVLFLEMKKKKDSHKTIVQQLIGAECFFRYCQEIGCSFWEKRDFLKEYKPRFLSIGHINIAKRKTRITRLSQKHDSPEKMMKIDWPSHLQFNHLVGK